MRFETDNDHHNAHDDLPEAHEGNSTGEDGRQEPTTDVNDAEDRRALCQVAPA